MARSRRKKNEPSPSAKRAKPSLDLAWADDEVHSEDEESIGEEAQAPALHSDEDETDEPLESKRLRLAKQYLEKIDAHESSSEEESSDDEDNNDRVSRKLQRERQKKTGSYERVFADKVQKEVAAVHEELALTSDLSTKAQSAAWQSHGRIELMRGHDLTPTCVALSGENKAVSGAKDHSVILWDLEKHTRIANLHERWHQGDSDRTLGHILAVSCSDDGRFAAVGKRDSTVDVFDLRAKSGYNLVKTLQGHKGPVTSLAFRSNSVQLFSASQDRCIRHYNLEEMLYLETLYGHQFGVTAIDCHNKERPISVGMDRTARAWKLAEDTHLIFRGGSKVQAADCVSVIKDDWFLTGHQDGHLSLWMTDKKRAVATVEHAHGTDASGLGRNVVSVAAVRMSDLALSGSNDGYLRLWKARTGVTLDERGLDPLGQIPVDGFINSIAVGPKAKFCVLAVGQEHRMGRWDRVPGAKNRLAVVKLYDSDLEPQPASADEQSEKESESSSSSSADSDGSGSD